jgi:protein arginine kinase activator
MMCENCGKHPATTHIHTVINGVVTDKNLCGYCAAAEDLINPTKTTLTDMLISMFGDNLAKTKLSNTTRCSVCGSTFSDFAETGKAGCANCYTTFYDELLPYLKRVHGSTKHTGNRPQRAPLAVRSEDKIGSLRQKLKELVMSENFEEAARVRDEIKELEGKSNE